MPRLVWQNLALVNDLFRDSTVNNRLQGVSGRRLYLLNKVRPTGFPFMTSAKCLLFKSDPLRRRVSFHGGSAPGFGSITTSLFGSWIASHVRANPTHRKCDLLVNLHI